MASFSIYDISPGETSELTFSVSGLEDWEVVSTASLEIMNRKGGLILPIKKVTTTETGDGKVEVVGANTSLIFNLAYNETDVLHPREPYYLYSVIMDTQAGRRQAIVPLGRLCPAATADLNLQVVKLTGVSVSVRIQSTARGTKT